MNTKDILEKMKDLPKWEVPSFVGKNIARALKNQKDQVFRDLLPFAEHGSFLDYNKKLKTAVTGMTKPQIDMLFDYQKETPSPEKIFLPFLFLTVEGATPPPYLAEKTREFCRNETTPFDRRISPHHHNNLLKKFDHTAEGRATLLDFGLEKIPDLAIVMFFNGSDELVSEYMKRDWGVRAPGQILETYLSNVEYYFACSKSEQEKSTKKLNDKKLAVLMAMLEKAMQEKKAEIPLPTAEKAYLFFQEGKLPAETHKNLLPLFEKIPEGHKTYFRLLTGNLETKDDLVSFSSQNIKQIHQKITDIFLRYMSRQIPKTSRKDIGIFAGLIGDVLLKQMVSYVVARKCHHPIDFKAATHLIDFLSPSEKEKLAQDILVTAHSWSLPNKRVIKHLIRDCSLEKIKEFTVSPEIQEWWNVVSVKKSRKEIKDILGGSIKKKDTQPKRRM